MDPARDPPVEASQKRTTVAGVVVDDRGAAVIGCTVAIFMEDPELWTFNAFFATATTDQAGRYRITTLAPGSTSRRRRR